MERNGHTHETNLPMGQDEKLESQETREQDQNDDSDYFYTNDDALDKDHTNAANPLSHFWSDSSQAMGNKTKFKQKFQAFSKLPNEI